MASRVGNTQIDVGVVGYILIAAQVTNVAQITALARAKQVARVAAKHLTGGFEEKPRVRHEPRHRESGIVDAVFAADQVVHDERPIGPGKHVIVERVDLAERRAHLPDFGQQSAGQ